jgi:membrane-bound lytic murein transglycosylase F
MPLLEGVDRGTFDCTVSDSHLADFARRRHPELDVAMTLTEERPLAWAHTGRIEGLDEALAEWFASAHETGLLADLDERWFGRFGAFDYVDVARFVRRVQSRLPQYRPAFERAAAELPFEWELLAAQAYQESHWDPDAVSATGVRGLMMLTLSTARRVGIEDRNDPEQSIAGGTAYLADLYERVPDGVAGEDRIWFALAAYNVGMGHMYDARALAERLGRDKNSWDDLARTLPLLSDPRYYETLRHGYARGHEPVRYVEKVREYRALLDAQGI